MSDLDNKINASLQKNFGEWVFNNLSSDQTKEFNKNMEAFMSDVFNATWENSDQFHTEQYNKYHIAGMNAPVVFHELVDILYPEGHISRHAFIDNLDIWRDRLLYSEYQELKAKENFSISGAMRWEFSQEAPIWSWMKFTSNDYPGK